MWVMMSGVYLIFLATGTLMVMSSSSWFVVWMGLEMNMMGFVPFVGVSGRLVSEGVFKYFLIQVVGSLVLFLIGLIGSMSWGYWMFVYDLFFGGGLIMVIMALKMGASPFHYWFLSVGESMDWVSLMVLMTWQKLAPLGLIVVSGWSVVLVVVVGLLSVLVGGVGGFNQLLISKIMIYSSIAHLGWMVVLFMISGLVGLVYFMLYVVVMLGVVYYFVISNYKQIGQYFSSGQVDYSVVGGMCLNLFSLGGLPPFLGFYPKWLGLMVMLGAGYFWLVGFYLMVGLMALYFYLRLGYMWFLGGMVIGPWTYNSGSMYFFGAWVGWGSVGMLPFCLYYFV